MRISLAFLAALLLFISCDDTSSTEHASEQTDQRPAPPVQQVPGVEVKTIVTPKLTSGNYATSAVSYVADPVDVFHVYNTFSQIPTGQHVYEYALWPEGASYTYTPPSLENNTEEAMAEYDFNTGSYAFNVAVGNQQNVWSSLKVSDVFINHGPGNYFFDTYLDGNLVNRIPIKYLSKEEMESGEYPAYWLSDKYYTQYTVGPETDKAEQWKTSYFSDQGNWIVSLVPPVGYKEFNRYFAVSKVKDRTDEYQLIEINAQGTVELRRIKTSEPDELQFHTYLDGDDLYFYNYSGRFNTQYDLEAQSANPSGPPASVQIPGRGIFPSPKEGFSILMSCKEEAVFLIHEGEKRKLAEYSCEGGMSGRATWSEDGSKAYFSAQGIYEYNVGTGELEKIIFDERANNVVSFRNNNFDFLMYTLTYPKTSNLMVATDRQNAHGPGYFEDQYDYRSTFSRTFSAVNGTPAPLQVTYLSEPKVIVDKSVYQEMEGFKTSVYEIGKVNNGPLSGSKLLKIHLNDVSECKECEDERYIDDFFTYALHRGDSLVFLQRHIYDRLYMGKELIKDNQLHLRDPGYVLNNTPLFTGASFFGLDRTSVISELEQLSTITVDSVQLKLVATTVNKDRMSGNNTLSEYTEIGKTDRGYPVYVKNEDDGSFTLFPKDGSVLIYTYDFEGEIEGYELTAEDFVPFTNRTCSGRPFDLANIVESITLTNHKKAGRYSGRNIHLPEDNAKVLQKAYAEYKEATDNYTDMEGFTQKTYNAFVRSVPTFYWEDGLGRYVQFIRKEYLAPLACEPILYLYPKEELDVDITLDEKVELLTTYPKYRAGWNVRATKNGEFSDYHSRAKEHRLFWEGVSDHLPPLQKGFVVSKDNMDAFLDEKLAYLGLNKMETKEFKEAWLPELQEKAWCFIGFYEPQYIDRYAPIAVSPEPDQFIRILMDYRPLDKPVEIEAPVLQKAPPREGFTVVEWGGLKR